MLDKLDFGFLDIWRNIDHNSRILVEIASSRRIIIIYIYFNYLFLMQILRQICVKILARAIVCRFYLVAEWIGHISCSFTSI